MKNNKSINFTALYKDLSSVTSQAVINRLQLKNKSLRNFLRNEFEPKFGKGNDFFAQPVLEATFGWEPAGKEFDLQGLVNSGILNKSLVNNLTTPPMPVPDTEKEIQAYQEKGIGEDRWDENIQEDYTWPIDRPPYKHQIEAWQHLIDDETKSVVVTSGTGSGKTECFLVPLLNDLAKQAEQSSDPLVGTQVIFLYPLNALINSQRERLSAWTRGFNGKIKFALYNGETPKSESNNNKKAKKTEQKAPEQLFYRKDIWATPPPMLVTNATMLEYMMVRQEDQAILSQSQGKLKWIVLDEAHTYVGSQAAEISLLLRRVMHAYGVEPKNVRFIATSATIGDKNKEVETNYKLQEFLAKLAGVNIKQVAVVNGQRLIPSIDESINEKEFSLKKAKKMDSGQLFDYFSSFVELRTLRSRLTKEPLTLEQITEILSPEKQEKVTQSDLKLTLSIIDLAVTAYPQGNEKQEQSFLPVRAHIFHRAQRGFWACIDPNCCNKKGTELEFDWKFGKVYTYEKSHCDGECAAPVFELTHCTDCGTPSLAAAKTTAKDGIKLFENREVDLLDDYADEAENDEEDEFFDTEFDANVHIFSQQDALGNQHDKLGCTSIYIDSKNNRLSNKKEEGLLPLYYNQSDRKEGVRCACCHGVENKPNTLFKRAILGSPFLMGSLVPALLRHVPSDNPYDMKGKRLITFTDSRQGTARFSAKMQLDSERNWTRSTVYQETLKYAAGRETLNPTDLGMVEALRKAGFDESQIVANVPKYKLSLSTSLINWDQLKATLAKSPELKLLSGESEDGLEGKALEKEKEKMPGEYAERSDSLDNAQSLAHLFLLREFSRRAKKANNLESMGLIQLRYPAIEQLIEDDLCTDWRQLGLTLQDWKDYLKICMDFFIRENTIVDIDRTVINWMGAKVMPRLLKPSNYEFRDEYERKACFRWPKVNKGTQHRLVRLIELAKGINAKEQKDRINDILASAWKTLVNKKVLTLGSRLEMITNNEISGHQLVFDSKVEFALIDKAWVCPITQRWLDTTFCGLSPYTKGSSTIEDVKCIESYQISSPDYSMINSTNKQQIIDWLTNDESIIDHKDNGRWSDISDAVIKGAPLIRTAEHSAQQDSKKLQQFEKSFKKDHLNVLSCSTTMEMGVDIGSLSMVAMNNVPPSSSNYLQRAGRAGRRQESTALALTFCKSTPHGERVFAEPKWPFITPINVPKVSLDSVIIVQRHVNAFLLANYLKDILKKSSNLLTMQVGAFFLSEPEADAPVSSFMAWLNDAESKLSVISGLNSLKFESAYQDYSNQALIENAINAMAHSQKQWTTRYNALKEQFELAEFSSGDNGAKKKLERQLNSVSKTYLLSELAATCYLPGYGFPTGVVSLVTENRSEKLGKGGQRFDTRQSYPSRGLDIALREYAPGSEIVVNGSVYQSQGLQLNWMGRDQKQDQLLRYQWECRDCASIGIEDQKILQCSECNSQKLSWNEYIQPAGFVVDYNKPLHNNYVQPNYSAYKEGKLSITNAAWQPLSEPSLGHFKVSEEGSIFHYNDGNGGGYALCWCCGRAEALDVEPLNNGLKLKHEPKILSVHKRLQGTKVKGSLECEGGNQEWSIKQSSLAGPENKISMPFILGYPQTTAMFELQLRHPLNGLWISDEKWMYTLGAALRQLYAQEKGIITQELGITVKQKSTDQGEPVTSLFIYDLATQGAGFSTSLPEVFNMLMARLENYLESCPSHCKTACHACLLDYDTQYHTKKLDRNYLLNELKASDFIQKLALSDDLQFFGKSSQAELLNAKQVIARNVNAVSGIDLYISGSNWSWSDWSQCNQILGMLHKGQDINIILSHKAAKSIDVDLAWEISQKITSDVKWYQTELDGLLEHGGIPLMTLHGSKSTCYATSDNSCVSANENWGITKQSCLVKSVQYSSNLTLEPFDLVSLTINSDMHSGASIIDDIRASFDGDIIEFGGKFINCLASNVIGLGDRLKENIDSVEYFDQYVISPISVSLMTSIFVALQHEYGKFTANITTVEPSQFKASYCVADNFKCGSSLQSFVYTLADKNNIEVYCDLDERDKLPHGRTMLINLKDGGVVKLILDQGLGYWSKRRYYTRQRFNFDNVKNEANLVAAWNFKIKSAEQDTYIAVKF
jgi:DEAD/DEAH box helicase domain-containing protein